MLRLIIRKFNRGCDFLYRYTPRFTTGYCLLTVKGQYRYYRILVPGERVVLTKDQYLTEVRYFNWFGEVLEPTIIKAYNLPQ